jgi:hypothetical protein
MAMRTVMLEVTGNNKLCASISAISQSPLILCEKTLRGKKQVVPEFFLLSKGCN